MDGARNPTAVALARLAELATTDPAPSPRRGVDPATVAGRLRHEFTDNGRGHCTTCGRPEPAQVHPAKVARSTSRCTGCRAPTEARPSRASAPSRDTATESSSPSLTPAQRRSPLARRPYDLRHAAVSTWLNAGVPAPQVGEWAGHSVHVLLKVYAKCIDGQATAALRKIETILDEDR